MMVGFVCFVRGTGQWGRTGRDRILSWVLSVAFPFTCRYYALLFFVTPESHWFKRPGYRFCIGFPPSREIISFSFPRYQALLYIIACIFSQVHVFPRRYACPWQIFHFYFRFFSSSRIYTSFLFIHVLIESVANIKGRVES